MELNSNHRYVVVNTCTCCCSGKSADIEDFWSLVTWEKGDNCKNRRVVL